MTASAWLREHRRAAAVTAGLVVVAVVATAVTVSALGKEPTDVVAEYLDAIQAGDTETALEIAGEPDTGNRLAFLTPDALTADWTVDALAERHRTEGEVDVDVTLRAGEETEQGRFHLTDDGDGWRIESPFVAVDLWTGDLDVVELGSARQPVEKAKDAGRLRTRLLLFPGAYQLYPSMADRLAFAPSTIIVTPRPEGNTFDVQPEVTLTNEGADAANDVLTRYVTDCAAKTGAEPAGCPFNAEEQLYGYEDVQDVTWELVHAPAASFAQSRDLSRLVAPVSRRPGLVRLTVTGVEDDGAAPTTVTTECEFDIDSLGITTTIDGFGVVHDERAYLNTRCYG